MKSSIQLLTVRLNVHLRSLVFDKIKLKLSVDKSVKGALLFAAEPFPILIPITPTKGFAKYIQSDKRAKERLSAFGFHYPEPSANFIFATRPGIDAKALFEALKKEDIYVRYFNAPRIDQYLRITIGTDEQMDELFKFLEKYLTD